MVDGNKLAEVGFRYLGTPYSTMDCQAFVEKCLADCGKNINLAGSNAWYREVMNHGAVMTPEECVQQLGKVPAGAFLFILQQDGKEPEKYKQDGIGNASHIGICTGSRGEGAIHSSASRGCVAESKFSGKSISGGWNRVGLWDQVAYDYGEGGGAEPAPAPDPEPEPEVWTAKVWAEKGNTVNLRKRASKLSALVERIKVGETVDVLKYGAEWCQVRWKNYTGYMMTEFLIFDDQIDERYTVTIEDLSYEEARALKEQYPKTTISVG